MSWEIFHTHKIIQDRPETAGSQAVHFVSAARASSNTNARGCKDEFKEPSSFHAFSCILLQAESTEPLMNNGLANLQSIGFSTNASFHRINSRGESRNSLRNLDNWGSLAKIDDLEANELYQSLHRQKMGPWSNICLDIKWHCRAMQQITADNASCHVDTNLNRILEKRYIHKKALCKRNCLPGTRATVQMWLHKWSLQVDWTLDCAVFTVYPSKADWFCSFFLSYSNISLNKGGLYAICHFVPYQASPLCWILPWTVVIQSGYIALR